MKIFAIITVLLVSPVLWADSWFFDCGKNMGIETKIRIDRYSADLYMAKFQYAGRDKNQTIKAMQMDLIGQIVQTDFLTGKKEFVFALDDVNISKNHLYIQSTVRVETKVKAMKMTVISRNPQKLSKSPFSCVLSSYKN